MLLVIARLAHADASQPTESSVRVRFHGEVSLFSGQLTNPAPVSPEDATNFVIGARWVLGARLELPGGLAVRAGATVEAFEAGSTAGAYGLELQIDQPITPALRLGGRAAVANSDSGGCAECGDGILMMLGPRVRLGPAIAGADFVAVTGDYGDAYGWQATAGITGRPAKYALAASAIGGAVVGILGLVAMSQAPWH